MAQHVIVIGAGVIGLQTAITLLEAKYAVTIIARHWPGDESTEYTSPWAGAIWRSHARAEDVERCEWDAESYRVWMRVVEEEPDGAREMGIEKCPIRIYSNDTPTHTPWYAPHVQGYTSISSPLSPNGHGHTFSSLAINPLTYLSYLHSRARLLGATFISATLPAPLATAIETARVLTSPSPPAPNTSAPPKPSTIYINATGLSTPPLCPTDKTTHPIRGQTLLATLHPAPSREILLWDNTTEHGDEITYILPRPGTSTFVLGGTKDADNYDTSPTPRISEAIVARCKKVLAACGQGDVQIEVLAEQVGFRPGRKGGPRIEVERVDVGGGEKERVVHCYGHAGGGFQSSIGCARKVLGLVRELEL